MNRNSLIDFYCENSSIVIVLKVVCLRVTPGYMYCNDIKHLAILPHSRKMIPDTGNIQICKDITHCTGSAHSFYYLHKSHTLGSPANLFYNPEITAIRGSPVSYEGICEFAGGKTRSKQKEREEERVDFRRERRKMIP